MSKIDSIDRARRFAKVTASDVAIYSEDKIRKALQRDRLFEDLVSEIREAEKNWNDKVSDEITDHSGLLKRALVDRLFGHYKDEKSPIF